MSFFKDAESLDLQYDKAEDLHRHLETGISVLVVGAGPAGLYTALECWRKGHTVVGILERNPGPSAAGDSFTVIGTHILRTWPALAQVLQQHSLFPQIVWHKLSGERVAGPEPFGIGSSRARRLGDDGQPGPTQVFRIHRPLFTAALLGQARALGIPVHFGVRAVEYLEDETKAEVVVESAKSAEEGARSRLGADVVVAADGVGTRSHRLVTGREVRALGSKRSVFRTSYDVGYVTRDPELAARFALAEGGSPVFELWTGTDLAITILRGPSKMMWTMNHKDIEGTSKESWGNFVTGDQVVAFLSANFPEVPEYFKKLVRTAPDHAIVDWQLLWRDPQPTWSSPLGRVVQVGDAAHTFTPSSGSGVNQALEDAVSLATCLQIGGRGCNGDGKRMGGTGAMWAEVHTKLRFERVSCCQLQGFVNHSYNINPNWAKRAPGDVSNMRPEYGWWILGHNPEHYAYAKYDLALRHLVANDGTPFQNTNIPPGYVYEPWTLQDIHDKLDRGERLRFEGDWS